MYSQMNKYFDSILSNYQFGFKKQYSAQQFLLIMTEKWEAVKLYTTLKAFDCLPHDLLIAKCHAYSCDLPSLELLNCCLRNRRQRVKMIFITHGQNFYLESYKDLS